EDELVGDQRIFIELNAELAEHWPNLTEVKAPMDDAAKWDGVPNKLDMLER
ncbi:MAG TPA: ferredoxin, partial [Plesiomonas shigelloides]|nr:ferredoxin [Plesiomonas shigelloides]